MLHVLDQLDQRQTRLGLLNVIARVGTRQIETRGALLRRFNEVVFAKRRLDPQRAAQLYARLRTVDKAYDKELASRSAPWLFAEEEWLADPRLPSPILGIDEQRSAVYLDLARQLGIVTGTYGLTELGTVLQSIQPPRDSGDIDNPLLIGARRKELALFTYALLTADAVTPYYLDALVDNETAEATTTLDAAPQPPAARTGPRTDLDCLRAAVDRLRDRARQGVTLAHALGVRQLVEYRERLKSENAAWHNARPRLEFFTDLGLLAPKPKAEHHHSPTDAGRRAAHAWLPMLDDPRETQAILDSRFFAMHAAAHNLVLEPVENPAQRLLLLADAFRRPVARPIGHTPARSVALSACLMALERGSMVEISDLLQTLREAAHGPYAPYLSYSGGSRLDGEFLIRIHADLTRHLM